MAGLLENPPGETPIRQVDNQDHIRINNSKELMNFKIKAIWRHVKRIQAVEAVVRMMHLTYATAADLYEWVKDAPWLE